MLSSLIKPSGQFLYGRIRDSSSSRNTSTWHGRAQTSVGANRSLHTSTTTFWLHFLPSLSLDFGFDLFDFVVLVIVAGWGGGGSGAVGFSLSYVLMPPVYVYMCCFLHSTFPPANVETDITREWDNGRGGFGQGFW